MEINRYLLSLLTSAAFSVVAVGVVGWLLRRWIIERLGSGIKHEYDLKLETFKARLEEQREFSLAELRTNTDRQSAIMAMAHSAFIAGQGAAMNRTLDAIDRLWNQVLYFRSGFAGMMTLLDILVPNEYAGLQDHKNFQKYLDEISIKNQLKFFRESDEKIEVVRPYVGEYLWALFFSYRAINLRIIYLVRESTANPSKREKIEWFKDEGIRGLLGIVLGKHGIEEFDKQQISKISWLRRVVEAKILDATKQITSGKGYSSESLQQASQIQQAIAALTPSTS